MSAPKDVDLNQMPDDAKGGQVFLLTIRGTLKAPSYEEARPIHNATAGNPQGVAACRSLGDLSHNVYTPVNQGPDKEILILDRWTSVQGLGQFFSDPQVQEGGNAIFESRDPLVWAPADVSSFNLPAPSGSRDLYVGVLQGTVKDVAKASAAWSKANREHINSMRLHGQLSSDTYVRAPMPGGEPSREMLGLSVWHDIEGMNQFYLETDFTDFLKPHLEGPPTTSVWSPAPGEWTEW